jgi:DNA-binding transcriptional LysR family regulator
MLDSSSWFQNALIRACNEAGYEPKFALECGHIDMVRSLVENGIGIALMENRMAQSISNSATSIVPIKQKLERQSGLAIPTYAFSRLPLATSLFRNFTLKEIPNELNKSKNEHAPGSRV